MPSRWDQLLESIAGPAETPADIAVPAGHAPFYGEAPRDTEGSDAFQVVNGTPLDKRLAFPVGSVVIDNNTSAWLNVPDATKDGTGRFVPPGYPAAMPILGHISRARINWAAPPGKVQPPANPSEQATCIFLASPVPPGFGVAQAVPPVLGSTAIAFPSADRAIGSYDFQVPEQHFARGMLVYVGITGGGGNVQISIVNSDSITGFRAAILSGPNQGSGTQSAILAYPGITVVASQTVSTVIPATPIINAVVSVADAIFVCTYLLLP